MPGLCWVAAAAVRPFGEPFVSGTLLKSNLLMKPQVWRLAREEKSVSWPPSRGDPGNLVTQREAKGQTESRLRVDRFWAPQECLGVPGGERILEEE